jgi:hypothetical protein
MASTITLKNYIYCKIHALMKNLYIIGNGFDIYHGLDTKYQSFAKYLSQADNEVYDLMLNYYGLPDISEEPVSDDDYAAWATFELSLADLEYERVLDDHSDAIARPASDDFRDRDWHTYQIEMEMIIEKLTKRLISVFNQFILDVEYPDDINELRLKIIPKSQFLNFNYTNTLERYYGVDKGSICYIHGKSSDDDSQIILGHGTDPSHFEVKDPEPPEGLSAEQYDLWREDMADQYDYSYESAKQEILSYYTTAFKNTLSIIEKNIRFFEGLGSVENIYVLGHSISPVDIRYFEAVRQYVKPEAKWHVSFYTDYEKQKHLEALTTIGVMVENLVQLKMTALR